MQKKNCINQKEMVNHPKHYCKGNIECIDAMIDVFGAEAVKSWCAITAFKYIWRLGEKDDVIQEASKCIWYLNKFIELEKKNRETATKELPRYRPSITIEEINNLVKENND